MANDPTLVQHIGKYEVRGMLGRGSTGIVYLGFDPQLQRQVAIKVLQIARLGNADLGTEFQPSKHVAKRFLAEAQSAGKLRHPNIIALYEGDVHGPSPFLVMEYVAGKTLDFLIKSGKRFSVDELIPMLTQLADAIDYAHSQGVLHRDIKPGNILIDNSNKPYILDFGVAKIHEQISVEDEGVRPTAVLGTPAYMSPEQIHNQPLNSRSDLFAFAIVAFQSLCGIRPFDGDTFTAVASSILEKPPRLARSLRPEIPEMVDSVFEKALAKDREARFDSAKEFMQKLNAALHPGADFKQPVEATRVIDSQSSKKPQASAPAVSASEVSRGAPKEKSTNLLRVRTSDRIKLRPTSPLSLTLILALLAIVAGSLCAYLFLPRKTKLVVANENGEVVSQSSNSSQLNSEPRGADTAPIASQSGESTQSSQAAASEEAELAFRELVTRLMVKSEDQAALAPLIDELRTMTSANPAVEVTPLLSHPSFLVKVATLKILIERKASDSTASILPLLDDSDPLVRGFSAKALGVLAGKEVNPVLAKKAALEKVPEVLRALENAMERIAERK